MWYCPRSSWFVSRPTAEASIMSNWMSDCDRAQAVYDKVSAGAMPPDKPWPAEWVTLSKQWMDEGRQP
jgi:hypothetical protein